MCDNAYHSRQLCVVKYPLSQGGLKCKVWTWLDNDLLWKNGKKVQKRINHA